MSDTHISEGPTSKEMAALLVRWRDRVLFKAAVNIENYFIDGPDEDFTEEERGFERGLRTAVTEICNLMADPTYFGRPPKPHDPETCGCGADADWCPYNPKATELDKAIDSINAERSKHGQ